MAKVRLRKEGTMAALQDKKKTNIRILIGGDEGSTPEPTPSSLGRTRSESSLSKVRSEPSLGKARSVEHLAVTSPQAKGSPRKVSPRQNSKGALERKNSKGKAQ